MKESHSVTHSTNLLTSKNRTTKFATDVYDKGLLFKIYKEDLTFNNNRTMRNILKFRTDTLPKDIEMANKYTKTLHFIHQLKQQGYHQTPIGMVKPGSPPTATTADVEQQNSHWLLVGIQSVTAISGDVHCPVEHLQCKLILNTLVVSFVKCILVDSTYLCLYIWSTPLWSTQSYVFPIPSSNLCLLVSV